MGAAVLFSRDGALGCDGRSGNGELATQEFSTLVPPLVGSGTIQPTVVIDETSYAADDPRGPEREVWISFGDHQRGVAGELAATEAEVQ